MIVEKGTKSNLEEQGDSDGPTLVAIPSIKLTFESAGSKAARGESIKRAKKALRTFCKLTDNPKELHFPTTLKTLDGQQFDLKIQTPGGMKHYRLTPNRAFQVLEHTDNSPNQGLLSCITKLFKRVERQQTCILKDLESGKQILERRCLRNPDTFSISYRHGGSLVTSAFKNGELVRKQKDLPGGRVQVQYYSHGKLTKRQHHQCFGKEWRLMREIAFREDGDPKASYNHSTCKGVIYGKNKTPLLEWRRNYRDFNTEYIAVIGRSGRKIENFLRERERDPNLTPKAYLDLVASELQDSHHVAGFIENLMSYRLDHMAHDHWQSPEETLTRSEGPHMLGDCEDYSFLAQALLERLGIKARVVGIKKHALCVWMSKHRDGTYSAHSICTYGMDINGDRRTEEYDTDQGFECPEHALNQLMKKYRYPDLGLAEGVDYQINPKRIVTLSLEGGRQVRRIMGLENFTEYAHSLSV